MSKFFNIASTAVKQQSTLLSSTDFSNFSTTNKRSTNNASVSRIQITNSHDSNAVKVSLYIEAVGDGIINVLAADYQASGDATITHASNTAIKAGMEVSSDLSGIPSDSFVALVNNATSFELNANTTVDRAGTATLTLVNKNYIIKEVEIPVGASLLLENPITFNVATHKLAILKMNVNTSITVIMN